MRWLSRIRFHLKSLFSKRKLDEQLSEEIRVHVEMATEANIAASMTPEEARYAALRQFGNVASIQEQAREGRGWVWLEQFGQDLRYAVRSLRKSPGFSGIVILSLAFGIGANTAIFCCLNGVVFKSFPYPEAERLVVVYETSPGGARAAGTSTLTYLDWERSQPCFDKLAAASFWPVALAGKEQSEQLRGARISRDYFEIFSVGLVAGRAFTSEEYEYGTDDAVILSNSLWVSRFGSNSEAIGSIVHLDGESCRVVGVLRENGVFDSRFAQVWRPLAIAPKDRTRNYHWLNVVGRLKADLTINQAREQMARLAKNIALQHPDSNKGWGVGISAYADEIVGSRLRASLGTVMAAAGIVLLIACVNVATLTLARGLNRTKEVAVRAALGAGQWRITRQFLTESILLTVLGAIVALPLSFVTASFLRLVFSMPSEVNTAVDLNVLAFAGLLTVVAGGISGLVPAIQSARFDLTTAIKQSAGGVAAGGSAQRLRELFVCLAVALCVVLLAGAGLLFRSLWQLEKINVGPSPAEVIVAQLPLADSWTKDPERFNAYLQSICERISSVPGIEAVAFASGAPLRPTYGMPFQAADHPVVDKANRPGCFLKTVSPNYFSVVGLRVLQGRAISDRDIPQSPRVALINEIMAEKYFPNESPLGKRILMEEILLSKPGLGPDISWEIVGVVANERIGSLSNDFREGLYVPSLQCPQIHQALVIRSGIPLAMIQPSIVKAVQAVNRDQQLAAITTVAEIKESALDATKINSYLLGLFGGLAVLLALVGIYGIVAFSVVQRTKEIGIRTALGAHYRDVVGLVMRQALRLTVIGMGAGLLIAVLSTKVLQQILYGITPLDAPTFVAVTVGLTGLALLACWLPARRAAKVDPMVALRAE